MALVASRSSGWLVVSSGSSGPASRFFARSPQGLFQKPNRGAQERQVKLEACVRLLDIPMGYAQNRTQKSRALPRVGSARRMLLCGAPTAQATRAYIHPSNNVQHIWVIVWRVRRRGGAESHHPLTSVVIDPQGIQAV